MIMSEDKSLQEEEIRVSYRTLMEIKEEGNPRESKWNLAIVFCFGGPVLAFLTIDYYNLNRAFILFYGGIGISGVLFMIGFIQSSQYEKRKRNAFSQLVDSANIPKEVTNSVYTYKSREKLVISHIESNYSMLEQQPTESDGSNLIQPQ